jgi:hypothetical protein
MIFEAAVACAGCKQQMDAVPQEMKRRAHKGEIREDAGVVVEVLDGVHAQAGKGLDVGVAVVQRVHKLKDWLEVEQAVGEVEVECARVREARKGGAGRGGSHAPSRQSGMATRPAMKTAKPDHEDAASASDV